MDGIETTHYIRQLDQFQALPIIAVTAHIMAREQEALIKAGINDYLSKPISEHELRALIYKWTQRSLGQSLPHNRIPAVRRPCEP